jgi:hypothetical protein
MNHQHTKKNTQQKSSEISITAGHKKQKIITCENFKHFGQKLHQCEHFLLRI